METNDPDGPKGVTKKGLLTRRSFLKLLGVAAGRNLLPQNPGGVNPNEPNNNLPGRNRPGQQAPSLPRETLSVTAVSTTAPEKKETASSLVGVKEGDNLSSICRFYGVNMQDVLKLNPEIAEHPNVINAGSRIRLPISEKMAKGPLKRIEVPGKITAFIQWIEKPEDWGGLEFSSPVPVWQEGYEYNISGHSTLGEDEKVQPADFSCLRELDKGDKVYFQRATEEESWLEGEVVGKPFKTKTKIEELGVMSSANSRVMLLRTCAVEEKDNPDARWFVRVRITDYHTGPPPIRTYA